MKALFNYVLRERIVQSIRLEIKLDKVVYDRAHNGNDARYFAVCINGKNVTQMVADAVGLKVSKARTTYGDLIIHGTGMDMGLCLQDLVYQKARSEGFPRMFDKNDYVGVTV